MAHLIAIRRLPRRYVFVLILCAGIIALIPFASIALNADSPVDTAKGFLLKTEEAVFITSPLELRLIHQGFVDVQALDPSIMVDLKYAGMDNFMEVNVYGDLTRAYLRPEAAIKLVRASEILQKRYPGLRLLVVDALRPRSVQHKMWSIVSNTPMQPYVANPHSGSMHNYGAAVDVTLYDTEKGESLDMGTPVDYFGPLAQPDLESEFLRQGKLSETQVKNRLVLRTIMLEAGWHMINIEWWHFDAFPLNYIRQNFTIVE